MKSQNSIFTKSKMGLDNSVWLTMLITLIIATAVLSFKATTHTDCSLDEIYTAGIRQQTDNFFYVGETITFSLPNQSKDSLQWDFRDGSALQKGGKTIQHKFLKQGNFNVTCTMLKSKCEKWVLVNVIPVPPPKPDVHIIDLGPPITGPDTVNIFTPANYSTQIKGNYYQWSTSGSPDVKTTQQVNFTFYKEGPQILTLKIDGKNYTKPIVVLPKESHGTNRTIEPPPISLLPFIDHVYPTSGGPGAIVTISGSFFNGTKSVSFGGIEAKSFIVVSPSEITATVAEGTQTGGVVVITDNGASPAPGPQFAYIPPKLPTVGPPAKPDSNTNNNNSVRRSLSDDNLKTLLVKLAKGDPNVTPQKIAEFFCGGEGTVVKLSNEKKAITLSELCKRLQAADDATVESAKIVRDPNNPNCEINILVKYTEPKKFLGIKYGKKNG